MQVWFISLANVLFKIQYKSFDKILFLECSLDQSRDARIRDVCGELDHLIANDSFFTNHDETCNRKEKAKFDEALTIILSVKKIKRDLHIQWAILIVSDDL